MADPRDKPRGVVDTSVLVAGIAGFKVQRRAGSASAEFLRTWLDEASFTWMISDEILAEYKAVLKRLGVRRGLIGGIVNLLREEAEFVDVRFSSDVSPDPGDNPFCACAEQGQASFLVTLNRKDFPQSKLLTRVISPADRLPTTRRRRRTSTSED